MNRFAELLDRLAYEHGRNNKLRLMTEYFRSTPDPERGFALAALTGALSFQHAKPGMIRALIAQRTDPVLFELSYDYVGDLSETVALMWPEATRETQVQRAPSPLVGEGWGGGSSSVAQVSPFAYDLQTPTPDPSPKGRGAHALAFLRRHRARHPRQGAIAGPARALARCARRDRALGAAQARHRRTAHRRIGAARQDRGGRARRQGSASTSN